MRYRDFRTDTITQPTQAMREAMMRAVVGDDILGEDPTVKELEQYTADLLGKEAAMFTISGSMANQIAIMAFTKRGDEVLVGEDSHIFNLEVGGLAALSQVQARPLNSVKGKFNLCDLQDAIRPKGIQAPITRVLCLENSYNLNRGIALTPSYTQAVADLAHQNRLSVYLDGARIFNAATALGVDAKELAAPVDALMFCLSKGLAAPVGAMLLGSCGFIDEARWIRQRLGGGMRQAGHMAAAGLIGLRDMRGRLVEDHTNARRLAAGIAAIHPSMVDLDLTHTNIVHVDFSCYGMTAQEVAERMLGMGIRIKPIAATECRMVTHIDLSEEDIDHALECMTDLYNHATAGGIYVAGVPR